MTDPHPAAKAYRTGTHRIVSPAETIARLQPHLKPMGITRVANVTGLDRIGIPVVMVTRPNSRSVAVSQGKGLDLEAAKASALMESAETWHGERIALPLLYGSHKDLCRSHRLVDPESLPQVQGGAYRPDRRLLWIEARNLLDEQSAWLPYEMVHSDYTYPAAPGHGYFHCSTNGLASGNHILEALNHAICEVIERDATTLWHMSPKAKRSARRLDLASVEDPECRHIIDRLAHCGLELAVWDTTSDLEVPAFHCLLSEPASEQEHLGAGAGCHPCPEVALSRALTEAVQTRLTYVSGARDDLTPEEFTAAGLNEKRAAARDLMARETAQHRFQAEAGARRDSLQEDHAWLLERLKAVGLTEAMAIDLSQPELGIPVVRVVIPGLEAPHDDNSYVPRARALAVAEQAP
ncbi:MAG: YcaO-like family protein [Pseudomonadota bacterium]